MSLIPLPEEIIAADAFIRAGGGVAIFSDDAAGQRVIRWLAEHCQADPDDWDWIAIAWHTGIDVDSQGEAAFARHLSSLWRLGSDAANAARWYPIPTTPLVAVVSYHG